MEYRPIPPPKDLLPRSAAEQYRAFFKPDLAGYRGHDDQTICEKWPRGPQRVRMWRFWSAIPVAFDILSVLAPLLFTGMLYHTLIPAIRRLMITALAVSAYQLDGQQTQDNKFGLEVEHAMNLVCYSVQDVVLGARADIYRVRLVPDYLRCSDRPFPEDSSAYTGGARSWPASWSMIFIQAHTFH